LLWFLARDPRLGPAAQAILSASDSELILPATVLAEACWIVEHRNVTLTVSDVLAALDADPRLSIVPVTRDIIERCSGLSTIAEMHDRQIVATTLLLIEAGEPAALLTRDVNITTSGLVPVIW
jgi:predicted nucleic acid-binding protein